MAMARTNLTLPEELIHEVDAVAGPRGRSAYVAQAVRDRLKRDKLRRVLDETYGAAIGRSAWQDSDEAYRWVRSLRDDRSRDRRLRGADR